MKKRIHQFVHTLSYGDAISTEVLSLQRALIELGVESRIYAINVHERYKDSAQKYNEFKIEETDEIILHYSLGSILNELYQSCNGIRRTLLYHNITPASWFEGINPRVKKDIEQGIKDLPKLCSISDQILADSKFNSDEITQLGFKSKVLELPLDPARWNEASNGGILSLLNEDPALHLLHVGRIAPNKKLEDTIRIFYFLKHHFNSNSKLWFVGTDIDTELYSFSLKRLVEELSLQDAVFFTGAMTDEEVRAFYQASSIYICMSEHEGFCLPVIEAMHFGLPVVAYAAGALPDTLGDGGVLVTQKNHVEIASLVLEIHKNRDLREVLIQNGKKRVEELSYDRFLKAVSELFIEHEAPLKAVV